jgi:hypothetical protein
LLDIACSHPNWGILTLNVQVIHEDTDNALVATRYATFQCMLVLLRKREQMQLKINQVRCCCKLTWLMVQGPHARQLDRLSLPAGREQACMYPSPRYANHPSR